MAKLVMMPVDAGVTVPLTGDLYWDVVGSARIDTFEVNAGTTANINGGAGVDLIRLMGNMDEYTVRLNGSSAVFSHGATADTVTLQMNPVGDQVQFGLSGTVLGLKIVVGAVGATFNLGSQVLTSTDAPIDGAAGDGSVVSVDGKGSLSAPVTLDASTGAFTFTDSVATSNNVIINGYGADDKISIYGATADDYAASVGSDVDGNVTIGYNNGGVLNKIVLTGVATTAAVFSVDSFDNLPVGDLTFVN